MQRGKLSLVIVAMMLASTAADGRVVHGYSSLFALDTVTAVDEGAVDVPRTDVITAIYPNPFNPRTAIAFDLSEFGSIELAIYDLRGRLVRVVVGGTWPAGRYKTIWDGRDDRGQPAPAGTYCCRLSSQTGGHAAKLTLAR